MFCKHRIPEIIVSDYTASFVSEEFQGFISRHGTTAPKHLSFNELAERYVYLQGRKEGIKKMNKK